MEPPVIFMSYSHDSEEHKNWVLKLATRLRQNGANVVLDRWNLTLGNDLPLFMERGIDESHRVICICSNQYVEKSNRGTGGVGYEKMILTADLMNGIDSNKIIPVIRNNNLTRKLPLFLGVRLYCDFSNDAEYESKYEELLRDIFDDPILPVPEIGNYPFSKKEDIKFIKLSESGERYLSPSAKGRVTFDYSNNNGRFSLGQAELLFETAWSKASGNSIHCYNDPPSITSIGLALDAKEIKDIKNACQYDMSSRSRTVREGEIIILRNINDYFAAIKVIDVKDRTRIPDDQDEITFDYVIQTNRTKDFS